MQRSPSCFFDAIRVKARRYHRSPYLFAGLEDITLESVAAPVASDVAEYFQIVAVVRDIEYPKTTILTSVKNCFTESPNVVYCI